jgi:putative N6-adenine-specific DNA methylase
MSNPKVSSVYVAKCLFGLENVLADELKKLGADKITILNRAVSFEADLKLLYQANVWCRTALNIIKPIQVFTCKNEQELYNGIYAIEWDKIFDLNQTFSINTTVFSDYFTHTKFPALKAKDAIADKFREKFQERPSVDTKNPDIKLNLHIFRDQCTISLDSSGEPLFKRGYRTKGTVAPLNETLAAGIILLSEWEGKTDFIDPMCGSGTFVIEACMFAYGIAPNANRNDFGFMRWKNFDEKLFQLVLNEADSKIKKFDFQIIASDVNFHAINETIENIDAAGLKGKIIVQQNDFLQPKTITENVTLFLNPPYDIRLKENDINEFYRSIGSTFKHFYPNSKAWLISSNLEALKFIGLKPSKKYNLVNGSLECKLNGFELYGGSKKQSKNLH